MRAAVNNLMEAVIKCGKEVYTKYILKENIYKSALVFFSKLCCKGKQLLKIGVNKELD